MPIYMCHAWWFKQRVSCVLIKSESWVLVTEIRSKCSAERRVKLDTILNSLFMNGIYVWVMLLINVVESVGQVDERQSARGPVRLGCDPI